MKISLLFATASAIRFLPPQSLAQSDVTTEVFAEAAEAENPSLAETKSKEGSESTETKTNNRDSIDYTKYLDEQPDPNVYRKMGVRCFEKGHKIYGNAVYQKEMARFLPHECQKFYQRWGYGWHILPQEVPWYGDAGGGDDKAKEGYMPIKEDDEEVYWAKSHWGRYQNPWEYDMNSYKDFRRYANPAPPKEDKGDKGSDDKGSSDSSKDAKEGSKGDVPQGNSDLPPELFAA